VNRLIRADFGGPFFLDNDFFTNHFRLRSRVGRFCGPNRLIRADFGSLFFLDNDFFVNHFRLRSRVDGAITSPQK
jgi:hypothetical protein